MRAFIYCRVSTKEQSTGDHYSLDNQEQRGRDYAKMKKWQIVQLRKDIASGKNDERDGFQTLLAAIRERKVDAVIVYRLDRLSRNVRDIYDFLDDIKKADVGFVSVTEGFDTTTAMGRAMLGVAAVFAQLTREMISENTKDGLSRRAEAGLYTGNANILNGYDYDVEQGLLIPNEAEAANVRQIFDWYTEQGWGVVKMARMLNLRGAKTKSGGQWTDTTIRHVIRNPVYCGDVRLNDSAIQGQHEGIISKEQFALAQKLIADRATMAPRTRDSKHLLSGIANCGLCGKPLRSHSIVQGKEKKVYYFYKHAQSAKIGGDACPGLCKAAHLLEDAVVKAVTETAKSGVIRNLVLDDVRQRQRSDYRPKVKQRDKLLLELNGFSDTFTQWADRLDAGKIDEEQFERQNSRLLTKKKEIQQRLSVLEAELGQEEQLDVNLAEVRRVLEDFPQVWDELEYEERREVLRSLIEDLKVWKNHAELKLLFLDPIEVSIRSIRSSRISATG